MQTNKIDNLIIRKFIKNLEESLDPLTLSNCIDLVRRISREILFDGAFRKEIFDIIRNYIKTNCAVLQIRASTQKLNKERLVFDILRNNLESRHLRLKNSHIKQLYLSYLFKDLVLIFR